MNKWNMLVLPISSTGIHNKDLLGKHNVLKDIKNNRNHQLTTANQNPTLQGQDVNQGHFPFEMGGLPATPFTFADDSTPKNEERSGTGTVKSKTPRSGARSLLTESPGMRICLLMSSVIFRRFLWLGEGWIQPQAPQMLPKTIVALYDLFFLYNYWIGTQIEKKLIGMVDNWWEQLETREDNYSFCTFLMKFCDSEALNENWKQLINIIDSMDASSVTPGRDENPL